MQSTNIDNFTFRFLSKNDNDVIDEISHWQTMKYGYPIEANYIKNAINLGLDSEFSTLICCYYNEEPVGFNMLHRLGNFLPFWHFGFYLAKPSIYGQGLMTNFQNEVFGLTVDYNCKLAESEGLYDWFMASIDSRKTRLNRHIELGKFINDRYDSYDIAKIEPGNKSKYDFINRLIGNRPFKKPLVVIKRSLKPEFRNVLS